MNKSSIKNRTEKGHIDYFVEYVYFACVQWSEWNTKSFRFSHITSFEKRKEKKNKQKIEEERLREYLAYILNLVDAMREPVRKIGAI